LPYWFFPGNGGGASATSSATGGGAGTVLSQAIANGGAAGYGSKILGAIVLGGSASAVASAGSTGSGPVQADASAFGGAGYSRQPGQAGDGSASASAQNHSGEVMTTASAPGRVRSPRGTTALANATVGSGSGSITLVNISLGQAVSNAIRTPGGQYIGAMSAASNGNDITQAYEATAVFDFSTTTPEALDLKLLADNFAYSGFDRLQLQVTDDGTPLLSETFSGPTGLAAAETFFKGHSLLLGRIAAGSQSIKIDYLLNYNYNYPSFTYGGFGFTYDLASSAVAATPIATAFDFPVSQSSTIPEPSTWAMMLLGFTGLGYASMRRSYGLARGRIGLAA
jgi:hypothetical protein